MTFAPTADGEPARSPAPPAGLPRGRSLALAGRFLFLLVWLVSAVYVFPFRLRGWIPTDEGAFSHAAERVLNGEMPHRDFPEIYTGGLTYWNALAFRVFGLRLTSLRLAVFLCFLAFVPAVFAIASRFGSPLLAGLITLLAVAWSLPNYFAGSVSWYNLFLATWGTLALLRHVETGRRRWLFLAGVLAGVSCLFKVIGAVLHRRGSALSSLPGATAFRFAGRHRRAAAPLTHSSSSRRPDSLFSCPSCFSRSEATSARWSF